MTEAGDLPGVGKTLSAASSVVRLLPQIGGAVAGLSALGLYAGWREESSYYFELGAPWVAQMMPPSRLLQSSAGLIGTIGLFSFLSIYWLTVLTATAKSLRWWSIILLAAAGVLFAASVAPPHWFEKRSVYAFAILATQFCAVSAGLTVGEVVARLTESHLEWKGYHLWLLYCVVLFGLLQAPDRIGVARARVDSDSTSTRLPTVVTSSTVAGTSWRLIAVVDNSFVVVSLAPKREEHVFRILGPTEISGILSAHTK